jgi:hypothetical protein
MEMATSLCLIAYCPQGHDNVIGLIRDPHLLGSGPTLRKLICNTCLKAFEVPEYDLRREHVLDEELDRRYGKETLPYLP